MQLSLLQSRLAASLAASLTLLVLYLLLLSPSAALASEVPIRFDPGAVGTISELDYGVLANPDDDGGSEILYHPDFPLFDRSILGRVPSSDTLEFNQPKAFNLQPGGSACYVVKKEAILASKLARAIASEDTSYDYDDDQDDEVDSPQEQSRGASRRAESSRLLYISANTCLQPKTKDPVKSPEPPQLTLLISNSTDAKCPTTQGDVVGDQRQPFVEGFAKYNLTASGDIYIGITAPNVSSDFSDIYNFEVAVSLDNYFHDFQNITELLWFDSDSSAALLATESFTDDPDVSKIKSLPYELLVDNNAYPVLGGMRHSVCGLQKNAKISANRLGSPDQNNMVTTGITTRGPGGLPKQQFYFDGLNSSSSYKGMLVKMGQSKTPNSSKRQETALTTGGVVYAETSFTTLPQTNCKLVTDLEFCNEVQYAVPGNDKLSSADLAKTYDDYAKMMFASFKTVMMQIPCEAPATSRYSLTRTCEDCEVAYKRWLCTVSIPRCEDFTSDNPFAIVRNAGQPFPNGTALSDVPRLDLEKHPAHNASRNSFIDETIKPGPYRELLPCDDICYEVVRNCPAKMGLACPLPRMIGFNGSYGRRDLDDTTVTCNFPGEARTPINTAMAARGNLAFIFVVVSATLFTLG